MKDYYGYNDIKIEGKTRLSPSSFSKLYDNPSKWYKEAILKQGSFTGNTKTVIGTIIHARIHRYYDGIEPIDLDNEFKYVETYNENPEVDEWKVREEVDRIWDMVRLSYLEKYPKPDKMEEGIMFEPPDTKYFLGGSYDALEGDTIIDFKTTATTPKKINVSHWLQLLSYALILRFNGVKVNKMRVVYIVRLKKEPKVVVLEEQISDDDIIFMKEQIKNTIRRLEMVDFNPDYKDIMFAINPISRF